MKRLLILLSLLTPSLAFAAAAMPYDLLAPIAGVSTVTSLKDYLLLVFRAAIGITGVLAVVMIVICGVKLMGSPSVSGKSEAKQCIWNAIFGIILVLGSWLLLNTINPQLLQNDVTIADTTSAPSAPGATGVITDPTPIQPGWYFQYKDAGGNFRYKTAGTSAEMCSKIEDDATKAGTIITKHCFEVRQTPQTGSENSARTAICGNNSCVGKNGIPVGINRGPCSFCGQTSCTNVAGLPGATISHIQSLQSAISPATNIVITGGTECGHTTHGAGMPIFDLRKDSPLVTFISNNSTIKGNPSFGRKGVRFYKSLYNGYWYTDEGDHFHVCKDGTHWTSGPTNKNAAIEKACNKQ